MKAKLSEMERKVGGPQEHMLRSFSDGKRVIATLKMENRLGKMLTKVTLRTPPPPHTHLLRVPSVVHPDSILESSPFQSPGKAGLGLRFSQPPHAWHSAPPQLWASWNPLAGLAEAQPPKEDDGLRISVHSTNPC